MSRVVLMLFLLSNLFIRSTGQTSASTDSCSNSSFRLSIQQPNSGFSKFTSVNTFPDGDILASGSIRPNLPNTNYTVYGLLTRVSPKGEIRWIKYLGYNTTQGQEVQVDRTTLASNGDILGVTQGGMDGVSVFRAGGNGSMIWKKKLPYTGPSTIYGDIIETSDSSILLAGINNSSAVIVKLNGKGQEIWQHQFYRESNLYSRSITETPSGYFFSGYSYKSSPDSIGSVLIKLRKDNGNMEWMKSVDYVSPYFQDQHYSFDAIEYKDGKLIMSGYTHHNSNLQKPTSQAVAIFDSDGNFLSAEKITNIEFGNMESSIFMHRNFDYSTGSGVHFNYADSADLIAYRINKDKSIQWAKKLPYFGRQEMIDMSMSTDNGLLIAGKTFSLKPAYVENALLWKVSSAGTSGSCSVVNTSVKTEPLNLVVNLMTTIPWKGDTLSTSDAHFELLDTVGINILIDCIVSTACKITKLSGNLNPCVLDTVIYKMTNTCGVKTAFTYDTSLVKLIKLTDSTITLLANSQNKILLRGSVSSACGVLSDSVVITPVAPLEPVKIIGQRYLCDNVTSLVVDSAYKSIVWSSGELSHSVQIYTAGKIEVTARDFCNIESKDSITILYSDQPKFSLGTDTIVCSKSDLTLSVDSLFIVEKVFFNKNEITNIQQNITISVLQPGQLVVFTKGPQCAVTDSIKISLFPVSAFSVGKDTAICAGTTAILSASTGMSSYLWNSGDIQSTINVSVPGTFYAISVDANKCTYIDSVKVSLLQNPTPKINPITNICAGQSKFLQADQPYPYQLWNGTFTGSTFPVSDTGKFYLTVKDNNGCLGTDSLSISTKVIPPHNFGPPDTSVCSFQPILLSASSGLQKYLWSTGQQTQIIVVSTPGKYVLEVTDNYGCSSKDTIQVSERVCRQALVFPSAFTPNNDRLNDTFKPSITGVVKQYQLNIFNKNGALMFSSNDYNKGWDGKFANLELPAGVYVWICTYELHGELPIVISGTVVLIR